MNKEKEKPKYKKERHNNIPKDKHKDDIPNK